MVNQKREYLHEDGKNTKELMEYVILEKTSYDDTIQILEILSKSFNISEKEALHQLLYSNADLNNSVKLVDTRDNKIYGLLVFSLFNIQNGSPIIGLNQTLSNFLTHSKQLNGHSFVIDKRLRGQGFDKKMLLFQQDYINQFDFIWCGVEKDLKSHKYWEKLGFLPIMDDGKGVFYIKTTNTKEMLGIFIIKMLSQYENNYII